MTQAIEGEEVRVDFTDLSCDCGKTDFLEADGKCPYARLPKSRGMRRTEKYAAVTRDEGNAADGRFPTASVEDEG